MTLTAVVLEFSAATPQKFQVVTSSPTPLHKFLLSRHPSKREQFIFSKVLFSRISRFFKHHRSGDQIFLFKTLAFFSFLKTSSNWIYLILYLFLNCSYLFLVSFLDFLDGFWYNAHEHKFTFFLGFQHKIICKSMGSVATTGR